jgi:hypothetical protein
VVDVSQMRGTPALVLSGLILQRIFDHNQNEFTKAEPEPIPTIAVVEEAQSVLGNAGSSGEGPYITWVKEGRKYDLGAVLITQQPGSISHEILSQGDNWFVFHLLSAGDLVSVRKANAHFSDDLLSALLNEPIPGHGVFWSSAGGKSYPVSLRVLSFEEMYQPLDPRYSRPAAKTFAQSLKNRFDAAVSASRSVAVEAQADEDDGTATVVTSAGRGLFDSEEVAPDDQPLDVLEMHISAAIQRLKQDQTFLNRIRTNGLPWKAVLQALAEKLPPTMVDDRDQVAHNNVARLLDETFGKRQWKTEKRDSKSCAGQMTTWIVVR